MMTTFNKNMAIHMEEQREKEIARVMGNMGMWLIDVLVARGGHSKFSL